MARGGRRLRTRRVTACVWPPLTARTPGREAELGEALVDVDAQSAASAAGRLVLALLEHGDHVPAGSGAVKCVAVGDHLLDGFLDGEHAVVAAGGEQVGQPGDGEIEDQVRRADPQRVQQSAVAGVGADLDLFVDLGCDAGERSEVVVALGVDVHHARAAQERLVGDLLREHRLAAAERGEREHGRGQRALAGLREVKQDRLARAGEGVPEVRAGV